MANSKTKRKLSRKSTFTRAANQRNQGVQDFALQVLSNPSNYTKDMVRKAEFAMGGKAPKYGLGGDIFGGATTGASAGAALGPWGAVGGAVLGGVGGLIGGKKRKEAERQQRRLKQEAQDREYAFAQYEPAGQQYATMFANGGAIEGEPYESVVTPIYKPVTSRSVYLEGKKAGLIPADTKYKDFSKDPTPYLEGLGNAYKYDPKVKSGTVSGFTKRYEDIQEGVTGKPITRKQRISKFPNGGEVDNSDVQWDYLTNLNTLANLTGEKIIRNDNIPERAREEAQYAIRDLEGEIPTSLSELDNPKNVNEMAYFNSLFGRTKEFLTDENIETVTAKNTLGNIYRKAKLLRQSPIMPSDLDSLKKYVPEFYDEYNIGLARPFLKEKENTKEEVTQATEDEFKCGGRVMRKYPMGGLLPYDNETKPIEAEGGESGVEPDGDQFNIQGPSHANGGVPMNAEVGTRIFSDRIKVPGSTKTFSDANKKIASKIVKYQETIDDPNSTKIAKRTAERMLSRLTTEQDELFNQQQALNGDNKGQTNSLPKAQDGMEVEPWMLDLGSFGSDRLVGGTDYNQLLGDLEGDTNLADAGKTGVGKVLGSIGRGLKSFGQSEGVGNTVGSLAQAAPAIYNIAEGVFGNVEQEDPSDYQNISGMAAASRLRNRRYNVDPQLAAVRRATATGRRNIQQGARTRGELLSNLGGLSAMEARQMSDIYAQKQNIENQYQSEAAQAQMQLGAQSAATRMNVARSNAAARAARRNILRTGVSQASQLAQSRERTSNLKEADRIRLAALNQYFPNYTLGEDYQFNVK